MTEPALLREAVETQAPLRLDVSPDWEDVLGRAGVSRSAPLSRPSAIRAPRRRRTTRLLLAAALLLGLLAAAPALSGVGYSRVIEFLTGEPPKRVVEGLERLDQGAPPGMEQRPIVGQTGKVYERRTEHGLVRIWLTPTKKGGFCQTIELPDRKGRTRPGTGGCFPARLRTAIEVGGSGGGTDFEVGWINGRVVPSIVRLELRYVNGEIEPVELQNGFFLADVEGVRTPRGSDHPTELIGRDEDGQVVARQDVSMFYENFPRLGERPPVAQVASERPLIRLPLGTGGEATLFLSPSRAGGWCARLAAAGSDWDWTCARPAELPNPIRFALTRVGTSTGEVAILLNGVVRPGIRLEFRYQDGTAESIPLVEQHFLVSLPEARWRPGHRLAEIIALDGGRPVLRIPMATEGDAFYAGPADRIPRPGIVQTENPTQLPLIASVQLTGEDGQTVALQVRRETPTHWYEVLLVDGKVIGSSNLQWFKGGHDAVVGSGWTPIPSPDGRSDLSLFTGNLREPASAVRVVYAKGEPEQLSVVRPSQAVGGGISGFFLYEVTEQRRERQPLRFEALDEAGRVLGKSAIPRGV